MAWMEFEQQASARSQEPGPDVIDEKFPIGSRPFDPFAVLVARYPVETDAVAGNQIELFSEIGQLNLWMNTRDDTPYV